MSNITKRKLAIQSDIPSKKQNTSTQAQLNQSDLTVVATECIDIDQCDEVDVTNLIKSNYSWCDTCGHYRHTNQDKCPFNVVIEDHVAKELEIKEIDVKEGDIISERFEVKNLPEDTLSVKVRKIKNDKSILILNQERICVKPLNQIDVKFKFLKPMSVKTNFLRHIFTCEVPIKLDDNIESCSALNSSKNDEAVPNIESPEVNFEKYLNSAMDGQLPWNLFSDIMNDLTRDCQKKTNQLNLILLKELEKSKRKISQFVSEIIDLKNENKSLNDSNKTIIDLKNENKSLNDTNKTLVAKITSKEKVLEKIKQETEQLKNENNSLNNLNGTIIVTMASKAKDLEKKQLEIDQFRSEVIDLKNEINEIQEEKNNVHKNLVESSAEYRNEHRILNEELNALHDDKSNLVAEARSLDKKNYRYRKDLMKIRKEKQELKELVEELTKSNEILKIENQTLTSSKNSGNNMDQQRFQDEVLASPLRGVKVKISNLGRSVTQENLNDLCGEVGTVKRVRMRKNGSAEILFSKIEEAHRAIEAYNNIQFHGREMKLTFGGLLQYRVRKNEQNYSMV